MSVTSKRSKKERPKEVLRASIFAAAIVAFAPERAAGQATTGRATNLPSELSHIAANPEYKGFTVGVEAIEIDSGQVLVAAGQHQPLNPASNEKIVTALTALHYLHPEHRFETGIYGPSGRSSVVSGPIVLRGYGDPSLRSGDLYQMARARSREGIKRIDGGIIVDQRFYDDQHTPPAFEQQPNEWMPFRAPVAAVSIDENVIVATFRPGGGGAAIARFWPPGFVDVEGTVKLGEGTNVTMQLGPAKDDPHRMRAVVGGSIPENARGVTYYRRVEDPTLLAGYALKAVLTDMGIEVKGDVRAASAPASAGTLLAKHKSAPLSAVLLPVGKDSDNFYAEMLLKALGGERKGRPAATSSGADLAKQFLTSIGAWDEGVQIKNGSGLFDANRATAHELASALRWAYREPAIHGEVIGHLSVGGVDGTLHGRFRSEHARRAVRAKTGTLDDSVALSGFVLAPPGKSAVAFSILVNNCKGRVPKARGFADRVVEKIVKEVWGS
jgi:D-alanyl-D-alanine carboxypeptidase/D-alanyl-D-alanine-endopeptidase (penicillin-binding protein 4)